MKIDTHLTTARCEACEQSHGPNSECPEEIRERIRRGEPVDFLQALDAIKYRSAHEPVPWWRKLIGWLKEKR